MSTAPQHETSKRAPRGTRHLGNEIAARIEGIIFGGRVVLVSFYLAVTLTLVVFVAHAIDASVHFCFDMWHGDEQEATVGMLSSLDNMMIANVIYLIAAGSYLVYVKDRLADSTFVSATQRPQALRHLTPGSLKEKMAAALVGVSSVNLLQILINVGVDHDLRLNWFALAAKVGIHIVLLAGLFLFAKTNFMEAQVEKIHARLHLVGHSSGHDDTPDHDGQDKHDNEDAAEAA